MLIAGAAVGKTSLIYSLIRSSSWPELRLDATNLFVYLDCEVLGEGSHAEIFGQFAAEIVGTAFAPATEDFLYDLVGGHPLGLQVACFHAFELQDDETEIERRTLRELEAHFAYTWHNLTPAVQDALRRMDDVTAREWGHSRARAAARPGAEVLAGR